MFVLATAFLLDNATRVKIKTISGNATRDNFFMVELSRVPSTADYAEHGQRETMDQKRTRIVPRRPEAKLIFPECTISVFRSSCNYLLFSLIFAPLPSLFSGISKTWMGWQKIDEERKEKRIGSKKRVYTEIVISGSPGL